MDYTGPEEFLWAFLIMLCGGFFLSLLPLVGSRAERHTLRRIVLSALLVRWLVGVVVYYYVPYGALAEDNWGYGHYGWMLARYWSGLAPWSSALSDVRQRTGFFYYELNAAVFLAVGFAPLVMVTLNCIVGALTVWLTYRVAAALVSGEAAVRAAYLAAFFPSLVLWSSMNLRDIWVVFGFLSLTFSVISLRHRCWSTATIAGAAGLAAVYLVRSYLLPLVVAGLAIGALLASARRVHTALVMAALLLAATLALTNYLPRSSGQLLDSEAALKTLNADRRGLGSGGSAYMADVNFHTFGDVIAFLPIGAAYFFLGPFPLAVTNFRQLITVPEMLFWYWLLPQVMRGIRLAFRRSPAETITLLSLVVCLAVPYVLASSNMGTAYRHRAQILCFLLIFGAAGMVSRKRVASNGVPDHADRLALASVDPKLGIR